MDDSEQPPSKRVKLSESTITAADGEPFDDPSDFWDSEPETTGPKQENGQQPPAFQSLSYLTNMLIQGLELVSPLQASSDSNSGLNAWSANQDTHPSIGTPNVDTDDDAALFGIDAPAPKPRITAPVSADTDASSATLSEGVKAAQEDQANSMPAKLFGDLPHNKPSAVSSTPVGADARGAVLVEKPNPPKEEIVSPRPSSKSGPGLSEAHRKKLTQRIEEMKAQIRQRKLEEEQKAAEEANKAAMQAVALEEAEDGELLEDEDVEYEPSPAGAQSQIHDALNGASLDSGTGPPIVNADEDAEFMEAAQAQKGNKGAEWQYDTSDAESAETSSESSSDDDSEDESEDDYELLDPQEQAKILMRELGDADEDGPTMSGPLKTANEREEVIPPKPDITLTPEMKIVKLGHVENVMDGVVVIKADTAGDYQVLDFGSVLCLENRTVLGVVMDTLSRVREPRYTMGFQDPEEATKLGIAKGTAIYYVEEHSQPLFTKPLQGVKATDASNIEDEEAEEAEFSDDEKEAEHKRRMKQAKRAEKDARNGAGFAPTHQPFQKQHPHPNSMSRPIKTEINYDDEEDEEMYHKLARPDNLHNMTPFNEPVENWSPHRGGRGRGRGNFRGQDRGRGGRGRGFRDQNRFSPYDRNTNNHHRNRGQNRNFSSGHRGSPARSQQTSPPLATQNPSSSAAVSRSGNAPSYTTRNWQQPGFQSAAASPAAGSPPPAWTTQQSNNPVATLQTLISLPPGSHINPAFFMQQVALLQQQLHAAQTPPQQAPAQWPQQFAMNGLPSPQTPLQPQPYQQPAYSQAYPQAAPAPTQPQYQFPQANPAPTATDQNATSTAQLYELLRNLTGGNAGSQ